MNIPSAFSFAFCRAVFNEICYFYIKRVNVKATVCHNLIRVASVSLVQVFNFYKNQYQGPGEFILTKKGLETTRSIVCYRVIGI